MSEYLVFPTDPGRRLDGQRHTISFKLRDWLLSLSSLRFNQALLTIYCCCWLAAV